MLLHLECDVCFGHESYAQAALPCQLASRLEHIIKCTPPDSADLHGAASTCLRQTRCLFKSNT